MVVSPKKFNYRLIIGTLVIAIFALGFYSISSYNSFNDQEEFLELETKLVKNELQEMISLYDDISIENEAVKKQLQESKTKINTILGSIEKTKTDLSLISKYRSQINSLVKDNKILLAQVDSISAQYDSQKIELAKSKKLLKEFNDVGILKAKKINVSALGITSSLSVYETEKISETDHLEVCTTLLKNEFTPKGNKNIYVQILDANNNIVSERGTLKLDGESLKYSGKSTINNVSTSITACLKISIGEKENLEAGTYHVNVFENITLLGSNTITLK